MSFIVTDATVKFDVRATVCLRAKGYSKLVIWTEVHGVPTVWVGKIHMSKGHSRFLIKGRGNKQVITQEVLTASETLILGVVVSSHFTQHPTGGDDTHVVREKTSILFVGNNLRQCQ